ncbi:hypothetical protein CROQUDRAFT_55407 [Cronartium quercuum f. sp. fusiforme G11]|uniref:Uncharacterized protein n=1 Tax=Cronartium quercuum f. sp. fusiforme G11 TaxID=708437 RepID=A0A9P6T578_9BASI|nr:hypothetical protein CROQUDRAFT_55407 [Cronartium quercuum f. sp. fusiforme G11]
MYQLVELPNPWQTKANGRIIRHFPVTLYSDDTSGNVSKKWNKHMSFYCTLLGLPPKLTNQEFNMHFISTSNSASALELGEYLIDRINQSNTEGFEVYDARSDSKVLVMMVVLCHLGDSPMHAEIWNTVNPTMTLNPC